MTKEKLRQELKTAALVVTAAMSVPATATPTAQPQYSQTQNKAINNSNNLQRTVNIKEMSANGQSLTRHVYNWQEVTYKYYLQPEDFSKDAKLSKEQELECAAQLRAIAKCEAHSNSSIEDKYYHDYLAGKITETECNHKIKEDQKNKSYKSFTQLVTEERALLENDKAARKDALKELAKFREQNDLNKGIMLTDKVDAQIEQNSAAQTKTLSAAYFLKNLRQNG